MDEALIIKQLEETVKNIKAIQMDVWGYSLKGAKPLDDEIQSLEDIIGQIAYKDKWNGVHPIGMS